jgi:N-acetylmuramoyl-L-alanine amidase
MPWLVPAAFILASGCAGRHWYRELREPIEDLDTHPLRGRIIVLDPGHGGRFDGAVGKRGTAEKTVNLAVARELASLLGSAGARVHLTRTEDRDLAPETGTKPSLVADLAARVALAESLEADLFISLHHNADAGGDRGENATYTFYRLGDGGPSLDVARLVHRHLVENLSIAPNALLPGNYYILRNTTVPALLGEPSHISNPRMEKRLREPAKHRLEAEAYFLGILDYFARGVPRIENFQPAGTRVADARPTVSARVLPDRQAAIDPQAVSLLVDGRRVEAVHDPATHKVLWRPAEPLANGPHRAEVRARNLGGNAARGLIRTFTVALPPAEVAISVEPSPIPAGGRLLARITATVKDALGRPVADSTPVIFLITGADSTKVERLTLGGAAHAIVRPRPGAEALEVIVLAGAATNNSRTPISQGGRGRLSLLVTDGFTGRPVADAMVLWGDAAPVHTDAAGYALLSGGEDSVREALRIARPGYVPHNDEVTISGSAGTHLDIALHPVAQGALRGRRLVLDPAYGGKDAGPVGRLGLRAADVTLRIAGHLAGYLRAAGAIVTLTRAHDEDATPLARVRRTAAAEAERFLQIELGADADRPEHNGTRSAHYPGSLIGEPLARLVQEELLDELGLRNLGLVEDARFVLQQTPCPAVLVRPVMITHPAEETALLSSARRRKIAYALYCAFLRHFEGDGSGAIRGGVRDERGRPAEGALVTLDGYLSVQTDEEGRYALRYIRPGEHALALTGYRGERSVVSVEVGEGETVTRDLVLGQAAARRGAP